MILVNEKHLAELLAAELREALDELSQILGVVTPDDILGKIFSAFCIGK
jgi:tRNA modification GTPase